MARKRIEISFGPGGEVEIEAFGFKGQSCKEATRIFEEALGKTGDTHYKAEWAQKNGDYVQSMKKKFGVEVNKLCG
jgi:hypothetical protein